MIHLKYILTLLSSNDLVSFRRQLKQIRSLFLTNRLEWTFSCLHPPRKVDKIVSNLDYKWRHLYHESIDVPLHSWFGTIVSPVIMLTSRPDTIVVRVPRRAK